ncbi:hypothetical protein DVH24_010050 [Malus domestica]|uniref:Uncharacterized protein n=1 Tax=Malus domestica TaxID=3750 RepID=A0A498JRC5_MALDO|nr:hypothetical protein DVH24_010050 [Malus domestica]
MKELDTIIEVPFCCFFPHLKDAFVHYFHAFVVDGCSIWTESFPFFFSCFPLPSHRSRSLFCSSRPYPLSISVCGASPITACSVPLKPLKASSIRSLFQVYPVDFCFSFHCCLSICIASLILALSVCVQRHKICNKFPSIQEGCWVEFGYTDSAAVYHTKNLKNLEFFGFKAICSQRPRRFVLKRTSYRYRLNPQSQYNDLMFRADPCHQTYSDRLTSNIRGLTIRHLSPDVTTSVFRHTKKSHRLKSIGLTIRHLNPDVTTSVFRHPKKSVRLKPIGC